MLDQIDETISSLGHGASLPVVLLVAVLLGLRHASDPDHLAALSTLATRRPNDRLQPLKLGFAWGLGHATTVLAVGVPLVLTGYAVGESTSNLLERLVGVMIVAVAIWGLVSWLRDRRRERHGAGFRSSHVRTARTGFFIGLAHGLAGSSGVVLLILTLLPSTQAALLGLCVFALATPFSMAAATGGWSYLLGVGVFDGVRERLLVPVVSIAAIAFGISYIGM